MSDLPKVGVDIGSTSIKMVELLPAGKDKWKLSSAALCPSLPGGVVANQNNTQAFSSAIIKLKKEAGIKVNRVVVALPEEEISSHIVEMPLMSEEEVKQALQWQVEQYIPLPAEKATWSYQVIKKDPGTNSMEVLLVAAAKDLVNSYIKIFEQADLEVVVMETELMAAARAEVPGDYPLSIIVDIGSKTTDVGVIKTGQLVFARTIPIAGDALNRSIQSTLGLDPMQAAQYRDTYGMDKSKLGGKLAEAMKPVLASIATEVKKTADFYSSKYSADGRWMATLTGGIAEVPEIVTILSGLSGMEVQVGNPLLKLVLDKNQTLALKGKGPIYGVAIGLAMRNL